MTDEIAAGAASISITAAYPRLLMHLVAERGHDIDHLLQGVGLEMAALEQENARVSAFQYGAMVDAVMRECGDDGLGYALAIRTPPTAYGPLGVAMMSSETLGDALTLALEYLPLLQGGSALNFSQDGDGPFAYIRPHLPIQIQILPPALRRFFWEAMMCGIARCAAWLVGSDRMDECELWYDHAEPPYFARYSAQLPPTRHDAPYTRLAFPVAMLQRRLPLADKVAHARALAQCVREMELLYSDAGNLADRVRELMHAYTEGYPSAEDVADQLHMSIRTFKRKLAEQGTSFRTLLVEVQYFDAVELLRRRHLSLEQIAVELGYSDPANFTRAFKRWTGLTPSAFRSARKREARGMGNKGKEAVRGT
jgi:AraC-like DNA-binding protein